MNNSAVQRRLITRARLESAPFFATILSNLLLSSSIILQAWILSQIINQVFLDGADLSEVLPRMGYLAGTIGFRVVLQFLTERTAAQLSINCRESLRLELAEHYIRIGPVQASTVSRGKSTVIIYDAVEALDAYFSQYLPQILLAGLTPTLIAIALLPIDPLSVLVLVGTAPLIPLFMVLIGNLTEAHIQSRWAVLTQLGRMFYDTLQGLTTLKLLGQSIHQGKRLERTQDQYRKSTLSVLRYSFLSGMTLELIATISTALVAVEIGLRLLYAQIGFQEALFLLVLAPEFYMPLRMLGTRYHAGMAGVAAARDIFTFLEAVTSNQIAQSGSNPAIAEDRRQIRSVDNRLELQAIQFEDVAYRYTDSDDDAVHGISFSFSPGEQIALVGQSGAGKSTIANLLLRFITPAVGTIRMGTNDLQEIPMDLWRKLVAWVPQNPSLLHGTLQTNITLGDPNPDLQRARQAASAAELDDLIGSLPDGLATVIGERGSRLSSGQAQRLALARAFYKNAPFLILDEPTSAVDPLLEEQLSRTIRSLMHGRTVLTIAHRLPTIYEADRILFLKKGHLIAEGSHLELMTHTPDYAWMVNRYGSTR